MRRLFASAVLSLVAGFSGCSGSRQELDLRSHADRSAYPEAPYGVDEGDTIANYAFDTTGGPLLLHDLRSDLDDRLLLIFGVQTWPNACAAEADYLRGAYPDYHRRGVDVLGVLVEDMDTQPTPDGARSYFELLHEAPYRYAADDWSRAPSLGADLAAHGMDASPVNLVVDLDTMRITARLVGWSADALESHLYYVP